jgi:hypothetical protein
MLKRRACNIDRSTCRRLRSSKTSGATAAATMLPQRHRSATAADASLALPLLLLSNFKQPDPPDHPGFVMTSTSSYMVR